MTGNDYVSANQFFELGTCLIRAAPVIQSSVFSRRFKAFFGVDNVMCNKLWMLLCNSDSPGGKPVHLLWALMFLKNYATEHIHAAIAGCDEKTFRKWQWAYTKALSSLNLVRFYKFTHT